LSDHQKVPASGARTTQRLSAVALQNDGTETAQSRVIAKGQGGVAEQIMQLAFATGVNVRKDADLIEILEAIEIDSEIPLEALATVAEILSYIYRINAGTQSNDPAPSPITK
jgi:flagellar biosynthesis protein